jgi:hypothetical protein
MLTQLLTAQMEAFATEILYLILRNAVSIYHPGENEVELQEQLKSFTAHRSVCRRWNGIIKADSTFWTSCKVVIRDDPQAHRSAQIAETIGALQQYFSASENRPLSLAVELSLHQENTAALDRCTPLFQYIASIDRWESLAFEHCDRSLDMFVSEPWWLSLFEFQDHFKATNCFRNVRKLALDSTGDYQSSLLVGDIHISQVFPDIEELKLDFRSSHEHDLLQLPSQLALLTSLTSLRLKIIVLSNGPAVPITVGHGILTQLPRLQRFEPKLSGLGWVEDEFVSEYDAPSLPRAPLTHAALTTLTIPDVAHLLHFFPLLIFPALETLTVVNGVSRGHMSSSRDILSALRHITDRTKHLATLRLQTVHLSDEGMVGFLSSVPSVRYLYIAPHPTYRQGRFIAQLVQQSKTQAILPRLSSFTVNITGWNCTPEWLDDFEVDAFKAFATDSRRRGRKDDAGGSPADEGVFERLWPAELRIEDKVAYSLNARIIC